MMVLLPEQVTKLQNVWPCDAVMEAQVAIFYIREKAIRGQ